MHVFYQDGSAALNASFAYLWMLPSRGCGHFVPLLKQRCNAWLGFALAAFCAFYCFASPSQDKLSGL